MRYTLCGNGLVLQLVALLVAGELSRQIGHATNLEHWQEIDAKAGVRCHEA